MLRLSDEILKQPTILGCFGSHPKPDLLARMVYNHENGYDWMRWFDPVIAVGEAKNEVTHDIRPQMACAVQPTLHIFMAYLAQEWWEKQEKGKDPSAKGDLPVKVNWSEIVRYHYNFYKKNYMAD